MFSIRLRQVIYYIVNSAKIKQNLRGYTLVEIIVVIAIIVFVISAALYAINVARDNSQATKIAANFKQMDKAFTLWMEDQGYTTWPTDISLGGNPSLDILITSYGLGEFLTSAPKINNVIPFYDNDSDTSCSDGWSAGVNIFYMNSRISDNIFSKVDKIIDNSDGANCGKIKRSTGFISYFGYNLVANSSSSY